MFLICFLKRLTQQLLTFSLICYSSLLLASDQSQKVIDNSPAFFPVLPSQVSPPTEPPPVPESPAPETGLPSAEVSPPAETLPLEPIKPITPIAPQVLYNQLELLLVDDQAGNNQYVTTLNSSGAVLPGSAAGVLFGVRHTVGRNAQRVTWFPHKGKEDVIGWSEAEPATAFQGAADLSGNRLEGALPSLELPSPAFANPQFSEQAFNKLSQMDVGTSQTVTVTEKLSNGGVRKLVTEMQKQAQLILRRPASYECHDEVVEGMQGKVCSLREIDGQLNSLSGGDIQFVMRTSMQDSKARYRVGKEWHPLGTPIPVSEFVPGRSIDLFVVVPSEGEWSEIFKALQGQSGRRLLESGFYSASRHSRGDRFGLMIGGLRLPTGEESFQMSRLSLLQVTDQVTFNHYITTLQSSGSRGQHAQLYGVYSPGRGEREAIWYSRSSPLHGEPLEGTGQLNPPDLFKGYVNAEGQEGSRLSHYVALSSAGWHLLLGLPPGGSQRFSAIVENKESRLRSISHVIKQSQLLLKTPTSPQCEDMTLEGIQGKRCRLRDFEWQGAPVLEGSVRFVVRSSSAHSLSRYRVAESWKPLGESLALSEMQQSKGVEIFMPTTQISAGAGTQRLSADHGLAEGEDLQAYHLQIFSPARLSRGDSFTIEGGGGLQRGIFPIVMPPKPTVRLELKALQGDVAIFQPGEVLQRTLQFNRSFLSGDRLLLRVQRQAGSHRQPTFADLRLGTHSISLREGEWQEVNLGEFNAEESLQLALPTLLNAEEGKYVLQIKTGDSGRDRLEINAARVSGLALSREGEVDRIHQIPFDIRKASSVPRSSESTRFIVLKQTKTQLTLQMDLPWNSRQHYLMLRVSSSQGPYQDFIKHGVATCKETGNNPILVERANSSFQVIFKGISDNPAVSQDFTSCKVTFDIEPAFQTAQDNYLLTLSRKEYAKPGETHTQKQIVSIVKDPSASFYLVANDGKQFSVMIDYEWNSKDHILGIYKFNLNDFGQIHDLFKVVTAVCKETGSEKIPVSHTTGNNFLTFTKYAGKDHKFTSCRLDIELADRYKNSTQEFRLQLVDKLPQSMLNFSTLYYSPSRNIFPLEPETPPVSSQVSQFTPEKTELLSGEDASFELELDAPAASGQALRFLIPSGSNTLQEADYSNARFGPKGKILSPINLAANQLVNLTAGETQYQLQIPTRPYVKRESDHKLSLAVKQEGSAQNYLSSEMILKGYRQAQITSVGSPTLQAGQTAEFELDILGDIRPNDDFFFNIKLQDGLTRNDLNLDGVVLKDQTGTVIDKLGKFNETLTVRYRFSKNLSQQKLYLSIPVNIPQPLPKNAQRFTLLAFGSANENKLYGEGTATIEPTKQPIGSSRVTEFYSDPFDIHSGETANFLLEMDASPVKGQSVSFRLLAGASKPVEVEYTKAKFGPEGKTLQAVNLQDDVTVLPLIPGEKRYQLQLPTRPFVASSGDTKGLKVEVKQTDSDQEYVLRFVMMKGYPQAQITAASSPVVQVGQIAEFELDVLGDIRPKSSFTFKLQLKDGLSREDLNLSDVWLKEEVGTPIAKIGNIGSNLEWTYRFTKGLAQQKLKLAIPVNIPREQPKVVRHFILQAYGEGNGDKLKGEGTATIEPAKFVLSLSTTGGDTLTGKLNDTQAEMTKPIILLWTAGLRSTEAVSQLPVAEQLQLRSLNDKAHIRLWMQNSSLGSQAADSCLLKITQGSPQGQHIRLPAFIRYPLKSGNSGQVVHNCVSPVELSQPRWEPAGSVGEVGLRLPIELGFLLKEAISQKTVEEHRPWEGTAESTLNLTAEAVWNP